MQSYHDFLAAKTVLAQPLGVSVNMDQINPILKTHQAAMVHWMVSMGRSACFASFGLGKTVIQLEAVRLVAESAGGMGLIVAPLGVRGEFMRDANMLGIPLEFVRSIEQCGNPNGIYITNYETVRDGKLDPRLFSVTSLDEAAILRGFGGSKTFREFMRLFEGVPYKFIATATPSPNEFIELLAYSAYLEVMDVGQAKTRFFKRDSTKADKLTLHAHKEREFWLWVSSWALFVQKPSDIGGDDTGYDLPELRVHWHEIQSDYSAAGADETGQMNLLPDQAQGLSEASREKRKSIADRVAKVGSILGQSSDPQSVIWCDLNGEQDAVEAALKDCGVSFASLRGSQDIDTRETLMDQWRSGALSSFVSKSSMYGAGVNMQQSHTMIFTGISYKAADFLQAVHRIYRFLQTNACDVHLIYTENERKIRETLEKKWAQHRHLGEQMSAVIREFGLSNIGRAEAMARGMGVVREDIKTNHYHCIHNDSVLETAEMESDSVGLILTSIPFSTQYEYSPNYADFGHSDSNEHFFEQMDYLTPNLLRILKPGRMAVIHVKDRIVPGGMTGLGFQTVYPFHARCIEHYTKHGFGYMGMKTIVTDVVRENNQTYRLGWTEQCRDGTKMGVGMPEYLLYFRKPQTDTTRAYTDDPAQKDKPLVFASKDDIDLDRSERAMEQMRQGDKRPCVRGTGYSRARWQIDAHGFCRSSGDRFPTTEDICRMPHAAIFKAFRKYGLENVYEYEQHVGIGEDMEEDARLPATFMLLQPPSWHPDVWTDVARMRCLNGEQKHKGKTMHLCLARDSRVLTKERGYIPIQDVTPGEHALTHMGRWRKILIVRETGIQPVVTLKAQGVPGLTLTPDHKLWARVTDWARERDGAECAEPAWVEAKDTLGQYVNLKMPDSESLESDDEELWWTVGRWIADGHIDARGCAVISCGPDKWDHFIKMVGRFGGNKPSVGTAIQLQLRDPGRELRNILDRCGRGASDKRLPPEAFTMGKTCVSALMNGYLSGDGHYLESRERWMASSVSRDLMLGIAYLAQRIHGAIESIAPGRGERKDAIQGRVVNAKQEWAISWDIGASRKKPFIMRDGAWKKVRSIDDAGEQETWCLKVEEDESFTAEGCIVKNCPMQFDIADRVIRQLTNKGDIVLDPFGGLMTVPYRAIKQGRIGVGIELSKSYFVDGAYYCEQAVRDHMQPTLFDFLDEEEAADDVADYGIDDAA